MAAGILVIAEHRDGAIKGITREALTAAHQLSGELGEVTVLLLGGSGAETMAADLTAWASEVVVVEDDALEPYSPEGYVAALKSVLGQRDPQLVLTGHSYQAIEFFPRLAAALDAALVPDCVHVEMEDGRPVFTRKVVNGKLDARSHVEGDGPWLASLQQGAFPAAQPDGVNGSVKKVEVDLSGVTRRKVLSIDAAEAGEVDLTAADVIVAGGRGVGGKDEFKIVFDLAGALGAAVGSSRPPCDSEWVEHERQIGSSGQVVAPKLYFALGISGAIQHLVGMRGSQVVVAINKDANAPIFQEATYGIVGDLHEILPPLIEAVKEARGLT